MSDHFSLFFFSFDLPPLYSFPFLFRPNLLNQVVAVTACPGRVHRILAVLEVKFFIFSPPFPRHCDCQMLVTEHKLISCRKSGLVV